MGSPLASEFAHHEFGLRAVYSTEIVDSVYERRRPSPLDLRRAATQSFRHAAEF
jgi:hypothetical protein